jgi:hypothetical protein
MSIYELMFHGAHSFDMRKLSEQHKHSQRKAIRSRGRSERRVQRLEEDVGYLTLVLASVLAKLDETGTLNREDLKSTMDELDDFDGIKDGRLNVSILRGATDEDEEVETE